MTDSPVPITECMLNDRQANILRAVVEEYVRSAEPVSSGTISSDYIRDVSPATVRNDMVTLEDAGYLTQPHTSAGRVPTEKGYKYYIEHFLRAEKVDRVAVELKRAVNEAQTPEAMLRAAAKALGEISGETAIASAEEHTHYSGFGNLMRKPEFANEVVREDIVNAFDRVEEAVGELLELAREDVSVWIGRDNPLGTELASLVVRVRLPNGEVGLLGLMGPLRMRYSRNVALLAEAKKMIDETFDV